MTPLEFHQHLIALSTRFHFRVTSYYRSVAANNLEHIKGHHNSRHMLWLAADIILDDATDAVPLVIECKRMGLSAFNEGDHIHIQVR